MHHLFTTFFLLIAFQAVLAAQSSPPLRLGIAGLTHTHVHWILGRADRGDIEIVGIVEPNKELARRYAEQHGFSLELVFNNLEAMIEARQPEAICAFGTTYEHLSVVQTCAPRGIHVMVEKPLAVNLAHAKKMQALAQRHQIHLLTNYETTWYASNHRAYQLVRDSGAVGRIRKIVVHDGHQGPQEIGVNREFLDWLTDPRDNGGGALMDFGCYGANLITWLTQGQRPTSVTALTQQFKPDIYLQVDDEATILLEYPNLQGIIQASWNWPFNRKDTHIYGQTGYIYADDGSNLRLRLAGQEREQQRRLPERPAPYDDPFAFFAALIREQITMPAYDPSSLENNMIVMEILEAAGKSARKGKRIRLHK